MVAKKREKMTLYHRMKVYLGKVQFPEAFLWRSFYKFGKSHFQKIEENMKIYFKELFWIDQFLSHLFYSAVLFKLVRRAGKIVKTDNVKDIKYWFNKTTNTHIWENVHTFAKIVFYKKLFYIFFQGSFTRWPVLILIMKLWMFQHFVMNLKERHNCKRQSWP